MTCQVCGYDRASETVVGPACNTCWHTIFKPKFFDLDPITLQWVEKKDLVQERLI